MLYLFRKSQRWLLWLLLIVVVITFVFWGTKVPNLFRVSPTAKLSSYDGQKITQSDLQQAKSAARVMLYLNGYDPSQLNDGLITTQAVSYLIACRDAKKAGVGIANDVLASTVQRIAPVGNMDQYKNFLTKFGIQNPREFEEDVRDAMAIMTVSRDLPLAFFEPDNETALDYAAANVKATTKYVSFSRSKYVEAATQNVTSNDVQALYEKDPKAFAKPDTFRFVAALFKAETNKVTFAEQELKDYFDLYQGDYTKTNEFGETIDMEFEEARPAVLSAFLTERANEICQEKAYSFRDFVTVKEEIPAEQLEKDFSEAAKQFGVQVQDSLTIPVGNRPVTVNNGDAIGKLLAEEPVGTLDVYEAGDSQFQVYLLLSRTEAYEPSLEEAYEEVKKACIDAKAQELAEADAQAFLDKLAKAPASFDDLAKDADLKVNETQPQTPGMALSYDVSSEDSLALYKSPEGTPVLLKGRNGAYVAAVKEFVEVDPSFQEKEMAEKVTSRKNSLEISLFSKNLEKEAERILAEIQGNLKKAESDLE